jgi:hypothetical protein
MIADVMNLSTIQTIPGEIMVKSSGLKPFFMAAAAWACQTILKTKRQYRHHNAITEIFPEVPFNFHL